MTFTEHLTDPRTGRPLELRSGREAVGTLSDRELEREITLAALSSDRSRRYDDLLAERRRRYH
ncbi:MAG TPA: hypothetical protein VMH47_03965 [Gaiellaceae bacterium]|nr:hypothetical protein [Gaiellaceae bacterium]